MSKMRKGNIGGAKITPSQAFEIRRRYAVGNITQRELAHEYHLSMIQVGRIVRGESWGEFFNPVQAELEAVLLARPAMPAEPDDISRAAAESEARLLERMRNDVVKERTRTTAGSDALARYLGKGDSNAERRDEGRGEEAHNRGGSEPADRAEQEPKE